MGGDGQVDGLAGHHLDIDVHDGADHLHLAPQVHVQAGEITHDFICRRDAEDDGDRHLGRSLLDVFLHDRMGVGCDKADQTCARADGLRSRVAGIVEPGLRILDDIHGGDQGLGLVLGMDGDRQFEPVHVIAGPDHFFHRAGVDIHQAPGRFAQALGEGGQVVFLGDAQGPALGPAALDQHIAKAEAGMLLDVFEQDRAFALRRQGADIVDGDRLVDHRQDILVGLQISAKVLIQRVFRGHGRLPW